MVIVVTKITKILLDRIYVTFYFTRSCSGFKTRVKTSTYKYSARSKYNLALVKPTPLFLSPPLSLLTVVTYRPLSFNYTYSKEITRAELR